MHTDGYSTGWDLQSQTVKAVGMLLTMPSRIFFSHGYVKSRARRAVLTGIASLAAVTMMLLLGSCSSAEKLESGLGEGTEPASVAAQAPEPVATAEATAEKEDPPTGEETPDDPIPQPERPDGIDGKDADAAIVTAEYFLDLYEYANRSGDTKLFAKISDPGCTFCAQTIQEIKEIRDAGQTIIGGEIVRSEGLVDPEKVNDSEMIVYVEATQSGESVLDQDGAVVEIFKSATFDMNIKVKLDGQRWVIQEVSGQER